MKANLASEPRRALKFRFKFQIKTARMSRVFQFVARRKFRPTGTSHADAIFDDTGSDGVILADAVFDDASFDDVKKRGCVARRIHKKFCFKFYIDLPRTPHAPRRGRNSALIYRTLRLCCPLLLCRALRRAAGSLKFAAP